MTDCTVHGAELNEDCEACQAILLIEEVQSLKGQMDRAPHHARMMTAVDSLYYDFSTKHGFVFLPERMCTDMTGCIQSFRFIDPDVSEIIVFAGMQKDVTYERLASGEWEARDWRRLRLMDPDYNGD